MRADSGREATERGASLVESLAVVALVAIVAAVSVPRLDGARRSAALAGAAGRLQGLMFRCRAAAIMQQRATGLVFERGVEGGWRCFIAIDGDGDGILRRDIEHGVDLIASEVLAFAPREAGLGILEREPVPDPAGRGVLRGDPGDPVRAGRGDIITFTPCGHATPSSVYLSDHRSRMRVLRVYGSTGRVVCMRWRSGWPGWRRGLY